MIGKLKGKKQEGKAGHWDHLRSYRILAFILSPLFFAYLLLEKQLGVEINVFQKAAMIYTASILLVFLVLSKFELFKKNFLTAHYSFLTGVIIICLVWYYDNQGPTESASLILAANLIGIGIVTPKGTFVFFSVVILTFFGIGISKNAVDLEMGFMLITVASVISGVNYWRFRLNKNLDQSRSTFKGIFDSSNQKKYVLDRDFKILDMSAAAEKYVADHGITEFKGKVFQEVFIAETEECQSNFHNAVALCNESGQASFYANCAIAGTNDFLPKEFDISKSQYFENEVYILNVRVVAEQKKLERELIEHKDNVTQILENINYFVFNITFNADKRIGHKVNFVSSKVKDVYGYSVEEYIERTTNERIDEHRHPEDKETINSKFESLLKTGGKDSWRFRMKVEGFEGWRWIEEKIFIDINEGTNKTFLFGMVKDITEEIEAQERIVESEQRYRQIFENNLAGVYKTSLEGEIIECNPAFAKILGYDSVNELKNGKVHQIYFDLSEREKYIEDLKKSGELNNYLLHVKRKDGRRLIVNNNVSLILSEDGQSDIIVGSLVDVTELHETSAALRHSEEKYRLLFEESNNAILLSVMDQKESFIVDTNQMASELFGIKEEELVGKEIKELVVNNEDIEVDLKNIFEELEAGNTVEREWEFKAKGEEKFYAEVSFASVYVENESVAQLVIKDISERKQYETEILESRLSFKNIVDRSPASILIFSKNELVYVNPNGEDLFMNVLNSKDRNLYQVFQADKHQLIKDLIKEAENDINSYTEIELGKGDNAKKYSINVVNTIYNFEKASLFILQDITLQTEYNIQKLRAEMAEETNLSLQEEIRRHERTQRSLVDSTSRLKALFESAAHLYIISIDKEYNLVSFNQNFVKMVREKLGKEIEIGMNFLDIFPIEEFAYEIIIDRLNKVLAGEPSDLISKFQSLDGMVWMESFMSPILIEGQETNEISFISHDITEQIQNRRKILLSEENNRAILLAIPDILFKVNRDGFFTDYRASSESNEQAFRKFITTDDVKGNKISEVLRDKDVAQEILENVENALASDTPITHNFSVNFGDNGTSEKVHFENRYSKVNEDEVVIISRNVTDTIEYEEKLIESVKEKEVLLKEVHHRVKNNLQVINSILNLQSSYVKDDETLQIIIESQNRIRSMSYIHESLYQTKDFASINFQSYITNLVQNLVHSYEVYSDKTELDLRVEEVDLALDQAIPCGLILNELITNALKYAYPEEKGGKITIGVSEKKGKVHIRVQDFGIGLPVGFNISETDSLGLSLVDTLIDQLDGELSLKTDKGTEFLIIFDKQEI